MSSRSPLFAGLDSQPPPPLPPADPSSTSAARLLGASAGDVAEEAPPKQLAAALDGLSRAIRLIAEVRLGANQLLEAVELADSFRVKKDSNKAGQAVLKAVESTKSALELLRATGKELELAGVLVGAQQRYQDNQALGSHTPLVCPDGAVVAYSWKRQIAGQAASSAVDRTRLALKAFTEQKKRFLPHIDCGTADGCCDDTVCKRARIRGEPDIRAPPLSLPDILKQVRVGCPGMQVTPHQRSLWPRKPSPVAPGLDALSIQWTRHDSILDVLIPGVLRAVISLLPSPPATPDAVAVFSPEEPGDQVGGPWATSSYNVYQRLSECATNALHYYTRMHHHSSPPLLLFLQWLFSYRSLFSKPCGRCQRLIALDVASNLLLPPVIRPFRSNPSDEKPAYHLGCARLETGK